MEARRRWPFLLTQLQAEQYLNAGNWDIQTAGGLYFDDASPPDPADADMADDEPQNPTSDAPPQQPGGGRTLAGDYVPPTASSSSSQQPASQRSQQRGLRTLGDLQASGGGHGHSHDDGDHASDSDYNEDEHQDFFAGGEKSGLAVQNPNQANPRDQINSIIRRARQ